MTQGRIKTSDGTALAYDEGGSGQPVIFQHGLGGDRRQTAEAFGGPAGQWRMTLECRGHGGSAYGPAEALSLATFADDIERLADGLGVSAPVVGGISMGAALALRLAAKSRMRPRALILARPAWLFEAAPQNMAVYAEVGGLLRSHAPDAARDIFLAGRSAERLRREAPDNLASLVGFFARPDPEAFGTLLMRIAHDGPGVSADEVARLSMPVLVIGHGSDLVHPLAYARDLAAALPHAALCEITPKSVDKDRYVGEFRAAVADFLGALS